MRGSERDTCDVSEAALRLGVHPQSLYKAIRNGQSPVPVIKIGAKRFVIPKAALERVLAGGDAA